MNRRWVVDSAERVAATYVEAVAGLVLANMAGVTSLDTWRTAAVAALPAAVAAVKTVAAGMVGGTMSPASIAPDRRG